MDSSGTRFDLWHILSSTRILSTRRTQEVVQLVMDLISDGVPNHHLMLQVEVGKGVPARQWVGRELQTLLRA